MVLHAEEEVHSEVGVAHREGGNSGAQAHEEEVMVQEEVCGVRRRQAGMAMGVAVDLKTDLPCKVRQWAVVLHPRDTTTTTSTAKYPHNVINHLTVGPRRPDQCHQCQ